MIDHISTYAVDYTVTRDFYAAVFAPLGYSLQTEFIAEGIEGFPAQRICAFGVEGNCSFWVIESPGKYTPRHVAFAAENRLSVDQFFDQAMKNGGEDNGKPGLRPAYHAHYYGAFVIDPDGNNVEAVCHAAQ